MIDVISVKAAIGTPLARHQTCLSFVTYSRFLHAKVKPTTTYVNSPITGKQVEVTYSVEESGGVPTAFVQISIPLASATVGHNYAHAGLASINWELKCAALLSKITLRALGFTAEEVSMFMKGAKCELLELTWHTATASKRARHCIQRRTKEFFDAQRLVSSRHNIGVSDVNYRERSGKPGLLVTLKCGDSFRQYAKADQVASRSKRDRRNSRMSDSSGTQIMKRRLILAAIENHVRNEVLICANTFRHFRLEHPGSWTEENLKAVIDYVWEKAGLAPKPPASAAKLSPEAEDTWRRYQRGEDMSKVTAYTFRRHRASIKKAKGDDKDIAIPLKAHAVRPGNLGYQLRYDRRWEPTSELRNAALCEATAPTVIRELERGLAFFETGELPDLGDKQANDNWQRLWHSFAEQESGHKKVANAAPLSRPGARSGIGSAPLPPHVAEDQLIFAYGEWRVV